MSPPDRQLVIGPNASLSERHAWVFMGLAALAGLGIAGVFTALGYWPVLPFAGLELAGVGAALWLSMRRNRYREVITITPERLRIEVGLTGRGAQSRIEMARAWTQVRIEPGLGPRDGTRLWLSCSGQRTEVGRCLTDAERERLAARLRELICAGAAAGNGGRQRTPA